MILKSCQLLGKIGKLIEKNPHMVVAIVLKIQESQ